MADASVRLGSLVDVADIARIQVSTWRTAYAEVVPRQVLAAVDVEAAALVWRQALAAPPGPTHRVLVAFEARQAVGFAACSPATADDLDCGPGATATVGGPQPGTTVVIHPLLIEPRWGRRGHGSRLLAAAVDLARADGFRTALAWVLEADTASRAFFAGAGWAADGVARILDTGPSTLRELRLHADIS